MNPQAVQHSSAWVSFTYASFISALSMVVGGIVFLPVDMWVKAYFAMGVVLLVQTCIIVTKTLRDVHESKRLVNRIEDAKTERLLMEIERGKD
jgi:hypothetical protein